MKPTNYEEPGCNPISSKCVIWQGPDIPCIKLCKGDSVSDVVYKMAAELCEVLQILNVESYDLECLNILGCEPSSFQELYQFIIDRICELQNVNPESPANQSGCPDCVVNIAECFYYENELGDIITTMQLTDYVTAIGNRICELVLQINTINEALSSLNIRVTNLENTPPPSFELPTLSPNCIYKNPLVLDSFVQLLEQQFCALRSATGTPTQIFQAISNQCIGLNSEDRLSGSGPMSSIQGWVDSPNTAADTLTNIWLTICDMRSALRNIINNCCVGSCEDLDVELNAGISGNILTIYLSGTIPTGFVPCSPSLLYPVIISDTFGNSVTVQMPAAYLNDPSGFVVDLSTTSINTSSNLTIEVSICVTDSQGDTQCSDRIFYTLRNSANCPQLTATPAITAVTVSASYNGAAATITYELYDSSGTTLLQSNTSNVTGPGYYQTVFGGLNTATTYRVRVVISIGDVSTTCPFVSFTTLPGTCPAPNNVNAVLNIT